MKRMSLVILILLALPGCVGILPIPTTKHTPDRYGTRAEIENRYLKFIQLGVTTREDILFRLGEPDSTWEESRYFAYRWITVRGYVAMWAVDEYDAEGTAPAMGKKRHDLVIEFDDAGRVLRYGEVRKWAALPGPSRPISRAGTISIQLVTNSGREPAQLTLGVDALTIVRPDDVDTVDRIGPATIRSFHYQSKQDSHWYSKRFACTLKYETKQVGLSTLLFHVPLDHLPELIDYLKMQVPNARINGQRR